MAKVKVIVTGVGKIDRKLRKLPYRIQGKVVRPAMRAGLKLVRAEALTQVPVLTGATRAAIKVRAARKRKRGVIEYEVRILAEGDLKKKTRGGKSVFYPAVVQYGSEKQNIPPDPFLTRTYVASADAARRVTLRGLKAGVDREIKASS